LTSWVWNRSVRSCGCGRAQAPSTLARRELSWILAREGFISEDDPRQGLWVFQTRVLSHYRWLIDDKLPNMSACSNIEQHSWMGYYIQALSNCKHTLRASASHCRKRWSCAYRAPWQTGCMKT
jgi:N-terminal domain of (some) glycogen debranching enzymes